MARLDARFLPHAAVVLVSLTIVAVGSAVTGTGMWSPSGTGTRPETDDPTRAHLENYVQSVDASAAPKSPASERALPDVDTMIDKLAARLQTTPGDVNGWKMLGWSYFHTERYEEAASAYAKAVELDPRSSELKTSYEASKMKASERLIRRDGPQ